MAQLVPQGFDVSALPESEERVVRAMLDGLDESWMVVPSVPISVDGRDSEIDIVLVGFDKGAFVIEVKGGIVTVSDEQWKTYDTKIPNPVRQALRAKHALIKRLKKSDRVASRVYLSHLVAFPDNADFPQEGAGPECPRDLVLCKPELTDLPGTLARIGHPHPASADDIKTLIKALRPDISEIDVDGRQVRGVVARLADATADRLGPVIGLDENRRVYLRGSAGTGKTFVALRWYRRALLRGESTLYLCFNSPLARDVDAKVEQIVDNIVETERPVPSHAVGNFHAVIRRMMGDVAPPIPEGDEETVQRYWNDELPAAFADHIATNDIRFDTIIVDEAQDFLPSWWEIVENLLRDRDGSRLYVMADSEQTIYRSSWVPPSGITTLELTHNIRNSGNIAEVVRRLGGAPVPRSVPAGPEVSFHKVAGHKEAAKAVRRSIDTATVELGIPLSQIAILVSHRSLRDMLIESLSESFHLVKWDDRNEDAVICETVHRTKGLERHAVILVDLDEEPDKTVAYVGASRASGYLSVVGRDALIAMTGVDK